MVPELIDKKKKAIQYYIDKSAKMLYSYMKQRSKF